MFSGYIQSRLQITLQTLTLYTFLDIIFITKQTLICLLVTIGQALETPILSCCTIFDILQQQQRKFFRRQHHIFTQRAEADVEDEIDHFFQLERLFALEDLHFVFF